MQALAREPALFVDEQVVHNAAQPRAGLLDFYQVVDLAVSLDEELLEQVLGFGLAPGQPPRKTVQPVEMGPDDALESVAVLSDDRLLTVLTARPAIR